MGHWEEQEDISKRAAWSVASLEFTADDRAFVIFVLHLHLQNRLLQPPSPLCCSSQPENSMTPFDTVEFSLFLLYRGHQIWQTIMHLKVKTISMQGWTFLISGDYWFCAMTFVLGKSQFSMCTVQLYTCKPNPWGLSSINTYFIGKACPSL